MLIANGAKLQTRDPDPGSYGCRTTLMRAVEVGNNKAVQMLIASGANLNYRYDDSYAKTALIIAVEEGNNSAAEMLIANGAKLDILDGYEHSALNYASDQGNSVIAKLLINYDAPLHGKSLQSELLAYHTEVFKPTPLHAACYFNDLPRSVHC